MRRLYPFITGLLISLVTLKTIAQPNINNHTFSESYAYDNVSNSFINVPEEPVNPVISANEFSGETEITCKADFEINLTPNSFLYKKFTAIPWHSEQKKPVYICWKFGDGRDTCIQYSNTDPGPYIIVHHYERPGKYDVCIKILYEGGCESYKCKGVVVDEECRADFEKLILYPGTNLLYTTFKALPGSGGNNRPKTICWTFGDGKDTCIQYPENFTGAYLVRHKYHEAGIYEVCVKIIYYGDCEAKNCKKIRIGRREECKTDFEKLPLTSTYNPSIAVYKALPWHSNNKKPKTICWTFGDGKDTCITYPENFTGKYLVYHIYREPGYYEVCVKITYQGGCESYKCKWIKIGRPDECKADFERIPIVNSDHPLIAGFKAIPSHNNNKHPKIICWTFGDGRDTCVEYAQNFSGPYVIRHEYSAPGTYTVCVKIIYYGGCEAKKCNPIILKRPDECRADFEKLRVTATNYPLTVYYKALPWNNNNKKPKEICWKFGDGKDTCITYPENYTGVYAVRHEYKEPGKYEVCIVIHYYGGCEAKNCKQIVIERPDECRADFEKIPVNATSGPFIVYYKALPWNNNNKKPKEICWKFGDGKDTCITYPENYTGVYAVRHEYKEPGKYEVCIVIHYYGGCEAKNCKQIVIERPDECKADFEKIPVTTANYPLAVYYKALPWNSNNKKPKEICWKFGDGKDTCITYPENYTGVYAVKHEYKEPGNYEVCIVIHYYGGCEAKNCKQIKIGNPLECKADFERIPVVSTNNLLNVAFNALTSEINNKKPVYICWKFGDGKDTCIQYGLDFTGPYIVHHTYNAPGNYEVCIKILYDGGCEAKNCKYIKVEGIGECHVKLFELTPSINSLVRGFYASTWTSDNKRPVRVCWYFGDGNDTCVLLNSISLFPGLIIRHIYPAPGVYKACVKILFEGGCTTYDCIEIIIRPVTNACGGYMTDSLISPRTFKFKGYAIHNLNDPVAGYSWTFGDGSSATGNVVTHTYNQPGAYEICLTIKTEHGCETRICKKINVPDNTQSVLQLSPNPVVNELHVLFYSTHTESVNIRIVNAYGVIVRNYIRNAIIGANNWDLDVATLTPGAYTLYIQSPNQLSSQLFIKN